MISTPAVRDPWRFSDAGHVIRVAAIRGDIARSAGRSRRVAMAETGEPRRTGAGSGVLILLGKTVYAAAARNRRSRDG